MNPETQEKMNQLLGWLMDTVKASGEFVADQAPDVARQMVAWGVWGGWITAAFCIVLAAVAGTIGFRLARLAAGGWKCDNSVYKTDGEEFAAAFGGTLGAIVCLVVVVLSTVGGITYGHDALKATVAPKLYVLEQVGSMLK
jgi:hypothetical protein